VARSIPNPLGMIWRELDVRAALVGIGQAGLQAFPCTMPTVDDLDAIEVGADRVLDRCDIRDDRTPRV
jgi:hypothetical protein